MDEMQQPVRPASEITDVQDEIYLLGSPSLKMYLDFIGEAAVGGASMERAALVDEWRTANDYYAELEEREAGVADRVDCLDLDAALAPAVAEVMADARYRETFGALPTSFGMVELDRLVVFQNHVSQDHVKRLEARLGREPDPRTLFRFCLPLESPDAPVQIRRVGSNRYVFRSHSTDFRFHKSVLLRPEQIADCHTFGPVAGVVGLVVGFGSNFLNVIRDDKRYLLHNGYHRACALRALGITHAPCIIQRVTRPDELGISAKRRVVEDYRFFFEAPRPPLLKDYFDPKIRKVLRAHTRQRTIEVSFEIQDFLVQD